MEVFLANEQELAVDEAGLTRLAQHALTAEGLQDEIELSVLFIGADHMRRLNARFANNDYATDVLAFPMMEDEDSGGTLLGDVVICPSVARNNAEKLGHALDRELQVLLVHGVLHLLGYDHQEEEDKAKMEARLAEVLGSFETTSV